MIAGGSLAQALREYRTLAQVLAQEADKATLVRKAALYQDPKIAFLKFG